MKTPCTSPNLSVSSWPVFHDHMRYRTMIASVAAVCDLDLVVVGGGVAKAGELLFEPLHAALARYAGLEFIAELEVIPAELGGEAGLIGAAALLRTD